MPAWETLRQLLRSPAVGDTPAGGPMVREPWGRDFPSDYRRFVDEYGAGTIQAYLDVLAPDGMRTETANAEYQWAETAKAPELAGANPVLIAWGTTADADILCWDGSGADPDRWPVLVYCRTWSIWRRYDLTATEFLVRVLRGGFPENPLGGAGLFGAGTATFLTDAEQRGRLRAGLDPWTGEPDPYAGMYTYPE
ncbi:hypothetical protein ACTOB_006188 [Actinoplanes oblitus]|uniref:Knr4/Smi1-like domain-containing protein n=1 Tax=Actinoplanes oblitus TaxID=3040509 RepID=A0ABY8WEM6_9ACTN|nr:hypothetical protein [Actinoplanes oblitus]WIM94185.1 hypothetical protein ACTOB_006188 [Actinoplanes oblitus]